MHAQACVRWSKYTKPLVDFVFKLYLYHFAVMLYAIVKCHNQLFKITHLSSLDDYQDSNYFLSMEHSQTTPGI